MAATQIDNSTYTLPLSNAEDKCFTQRLVYSTRLQFEDPGDSITIGVQTGNRGLSKFESIRGLFFSVRGRVSSDNNLGPWFRVEVLDSGQFWDVGHQLNATFETNTLQVPIFSSAGGKIRVTMREGTATEADDCILILTNFTLEPYTVACSTSNEVG